MALIATAPGGCDGPLNQTRKIGVVLKLRDLDLKEELDSPNVVERVAEQLKNEFIDRMKDLLEGKPVAIIRDVPCPQIVEKGEVVHA